MLLVVSKIPVFNYVISQSPQWYSEIEGVITTYTEPLQYEEGLPM